MPLRSDAMTLASNLNVNAALRSALSRKPQVRRLPWAGLPSAPKGDSRMVGYGGGDFFLFALLADQRAILLNAATVLASLRRKNAPEFEYGVAGLWDAEADSLCLCFQRGAAIYGSPATYDRLCDVFHEWLSLGAPQATDWSVRLVSKSRAVPRRPSQWTLARQHFRYVFQLKP
jgi:hypothetical protein